MTCVSAPTNNFFPSPVDTSSIDDGHDHPEPAVVHDLENCEVDASDYHILSELGCGLQGRVELAYDKTHQRLVAIKLPTFQTYEGSDNVDLQHFDCQVQSIRSERDAMRLVHHDNVLHFERSIPGRKNHHVFVMLVMEYAANGDLFDLIAHTGSLPESVCQYYFQQLLLAVQACHQAGVIHRDVKPENILFDDQFNLKLCDFGLASIVPVEEVDTYELSDVEGTQLYMAPEIDGTSPFRGPPVDLWSCGVVLFIALTGFPPFEVAEPGDPWYDLVLKGDMATFWATQPDTVTRPSPLAIDLINKLLHVDPSQRITMADALTHPWLRDVGQLDRSLIVTTMQDRRAKCLAQIEVPSEEDEDF